MIAADAVGGAAPSATRTAAAPRCNASWMKRAPSVLTPGNAANRKPGLTSRLSAARPAIGIVARSEGSSTPRPSSSPRVMVLRPERRRFLENLKDFGQPMERRHLLIGGEHLGVKFALIVLRPRRDAENGGNALDDFARGGSGVDARCRLVARLGYALRLVEHDEDEIFRRIRREGRKEARQQGRGRIVAADHLFGGAGLA